MAFDEPNISDGGEAAFNMALATLKRINDLFVEYQKISTMLPPTGDNQILKYKMIRQIYLAALPLLTEKVRVSLKEKINSIQFRTTKRQGQTVTIFSADIDFQIDDLLEEVLIALQDDGHHFMPRPDESALF